MMNLRTLKRLSKRAAPLLPLLGNDRKQFPAVKGDNYVKSNVLARKHWERSRCHPSYEGHGADPYIIYTTRAGHRMVMRPPYHPRKGTIMVGSMEGYYEPEWDEETAWDALAAMVHCHYTDWDNFGTSTPVIRLRKLDTPAQVIRAALDMIAELEPAHD